MIWSIFLIVALFVGATYLFGLLYKIAEGFNRKHMLRSVGWKGFCLLGFVGVPFHELSHLIMALVFGYRITGVALYRPIAGKSDGNLGYVEYTQGRGLYRKIGSFFVGTAPMMFGAILLFALMRLAFPSAFISVGEMPENWDGIGEVLKGVFGNLSAMFSATGSSIPFALLTLLAGVLLCPHLGMSKADFKGAVSGTVFLLLSGLIVPFALQLAVPSLTFEIIYAALSVFVIYYAYALLIGLLISILSALFYRCLSLIVKRR